MRYCLTTRMLELGLTLALELREAINSMFMGYRNCAYATHNCQNYKLDKESNTSSANVGITKYREINNSPISEEFPARCR